MSYPHIVHALVQSASSFSRYDKLGLDHTHDKQESHDPEAHCLVFTIQFPQPVSAYGLRVLAKIPYGGLTLVEHLCIHLKIQPAASTQEANEVFAAWVSHIS